MQEVSFQHLSQQQINDWMPRRKSTLNIAYSQKLQELPNTTIIFDVLLTQ